MNPHTKGRELKDLVFRQVFKAAGGTMIVVLGGIFLMLVTNGLRFLGEDGAGTLVSVPIWDPGGHPPGYGIWGLLASTGLVSLGAMAIAVPLGVFTAAYMSELASPRIRKLLKPTVELLASIPSVAVGFAGILVVGPGLARLFHLSSGLNALNGAILLAIMALPTIISISEDAIRAVPHAHREASLALGADRWQTLYRITLPAALPGLIAAVMLGLGRALGETMTVLMATGNATAMPDGFLSPIRTITATIAIEMGEVPYHSPHYYSLFAIALVLFLMTMGINLLGERYATRLRRFQ